MKSRLMLGGLMLLVVGLAGCANPMVMKIKDNSKVIVGAAQSAKDSHEDCVRKNDKNACEDVVKFLDQIIEVSNETDDIAK